MKKIILLFFLLTLTTFLGCSDKNSAETDYISVADPKTASMLPIKAVQEGTPISAEPSTEDISEAPYSYFEIDKLLGPGPFSVNSLAEVFGEPVKAFGTIVSMSSGDIGIVAEFEGISFLLAANNGETLSFDFNSIYDELSSDGSENTPDYKLADSDKAVLLKPFQTTVTGTSIRLPRNIKIGDSRQIIIDAYDGDSGNEWEYEGRLVASYSYRPNVIESFTSDEDFNLESQTGAVSYHFENDSLVQMRISWYNGYLAFD